MSSAEWERLRRVLADEGVRGVEDMGHFVNDSRHFAPAQFDERAAMPVLIRELPQLADPTLVAAVAGHLRRPWARPVAFDALLAAFTQWAPADESTGWQLGDAVGTTASKERTPQLLALCQDPTLGKSRQMIVYALRRFGSQPGVVETLERLASDPDVTLHALSSLRVAAGAEEALRVGRALVALDPTSNRGTIAAREVRKLERAIAKQTDGSG